jgi:hypothetical protein
VFSSMPILNLFFPTPNLGFCKISPHHSLNQTLKVTPFSPFIHQDLFLLVFLINLVPITKHYRTLKWPKDVHICPSLCIWLKIKIIPLVNLWKFSKHNNSHLNV